MARLTTMRYHLTRPWLLALLAAAILSAPLHAQVPRTVQATWAQFDARAEPLEVELIRESREAEIVLRHVRYLVGTFAGKPARVAAFYAFPVDAKQLPGIVQIHGGGQRALPDTARYWASQGYAAVAVNWGEHPIDQPDDPRTDWAGIPAGFYDPKHHNDVSPGEGTLHDSPHPWNSSWLLYSAAVRRAITFLEQQPEADGANVGLTGHSMGGRLTVLSAIDPRVKAASPSVGGSGYLYDDLAGVPGSARRMQSDLELYNATLDCRNYWPLIQCPLMFLGATNDFNSPMEFVVRGFRLLPQQSGAMSFTPHMNHRFTADNYAARVRWFQTHLKGEFVFPKTARAQLELKTDDRTPRLRVWPDRSTPHRVQSVVVYYGYDRDPRARFWRAAHVEPEGDAFVARCPVMELGEPLFAFANVTYDTGQTLPLPRGYEPTSLLTVTSECRQALPQQLAAANLTASGERQRLIDDFRDGWRDWSLVSATNPQHWNFETHKVCDPAYFGPRGAALAIDVETSEPGNTLAVVMETDRWRSYTGRPTLRYTALIGLPSAGRQQLEISLDRFVTSDGQVLASYDFVTSLILTPGQKERPEQIEQPWCGGVPTFREIRWVGGEFAPRPRPYLRLGASQIDADAAFRKQFAAAVDESVEREAVDRQP
ncbi:MAG: dienelactone hydrolase family protein [Planctomycetales bacterium]|nr:dienelactone hydrolase family protein [Planctomycetales bacterium]